MSSPAPDPADRRAAGKPGRAGEDALERYVRAYVAEVRARVAQRADRPEPGPGDSR
jgi:hypothetical protein